MSTTTPTAAALDAGRLRLTVTTALAPTAWGTTYLVTTELLPPDHPVFASVTRALPAGLLALALARQLPRGIWWWRSLVLGALNIGIFFPLLFVAAERLPGGIAATLGAVQPLVVAGLATAVLHEAPSLWRFGWGLAGLIGVGSSSSAPRHHLMRSEWPPASPVPAPWHSGSPSPSGGGDRLASRPSGSPAGSSLPVESSSSR
jgi:probable blue pigment (indigoidine) exporter